MERGHGFVLQSMTEEIDADRIQRRIDELSEIGRTADDGVSRLAYTPEENEAFEYLRGEIPDEYTVETDSIGNLFASPTPDAAQSFYVGSHLDSVYNGGRLDGALGVVTALEAIQTLDTVEEEVPYPPTLVVFRAEESSRFGQHTIGSRGMLGMLRIEDFSATDRNGVPLWQAMQEVGLRPSDLTEPTRDRSRVAGFLELHIEQGRVLDEQDTDVGVVTSIRAPVRYRVRVTGKYDHSGATPMSLRQDALVAASEMIVAVEELATEADQDGDIVATVGDVTAVDGAINKVCGKVTFPLDIRSNDEAYRDAVERRILGQFDEISADKTVEVEMEELNRTEPVQLDDDIVSTIDGVAAELDVDHLRLPSGGGHDAMNFQTQGVPTGMLFVPSVDGISHNPEEATDPDAVAAATRVMAEAIRRGPDGGV